MIARAGKLFYLPRSTKSHLLHQLVNLLVYTVNLNNEKTFHKIKIEQNGKGAIK